MLIHTRRGKIVGNHCGQSAKIGTPANPRHSVHEAVPLMIGPQSSAKMVGGYGTSVDHALAMAFDDPMMYQDLRETLATDEIVPGEEWPDVW